MAGNNKYRNLGLTGRSGPFSAGFFWVRIFLAAIVVSCVPDQNDSTWVGEETFTIGQYLKGHQKEYSKFYRILQTGKMISPLMAYNPHGEGYTLFLPTDEAVDQFLTDHPEYKSFEALLADSVFLYTLTRYHTVKRKVHTDEFPDGGLTDSTLTGQRLSVGYYPDGSNQVIRINNTAAVVHSNLEMTNGYIHVISGVLQQPEISGYDRLQQLNGYSILAKAMELAGIRGKLKWNKYTLLVEHDSVFHRKGIMNIQDLTGRVATPGVPLTSSNNAFYLFAAYHVLSGELYLNDFELGEHKYLTLANRPVTIDAGQQIKLNTGVDIYGQIITGSGDTLLIDYLLPVWEASNVMTKTGPVHSVSQVLFYEPFPE